LTSQPGVANRADFSYFSFSLIANCVSSSACVGVGPLHSQSRSRFLRRRRSWQQLFYRSSVGVGEPDSAFSARLVPEFHFNGPSLGHSSRLLHKLHSGEPSRNHPSKPTTTSSRPADAECPICDLPVSSRCQCCAEFFCDRHIYHCSDCCVDLCGSCLDTHSLESHRTAAAQHCDRAAHSLESDRTTAARYSDATGHSAQHPALASHLGSETALLSPPRPFSSRETAVLSPTQPSSSGNAFLSPTHSSLRDAACPDQPAEIFLLSAEAMQ
jgi:hypothetical protein